MSEEQVHVAVRRAFDAIAPMYDASFRAPRNLIMEWLRQENLRLLSSIFPPHSRLVDIGCGTGDEAIFLAQRGAFVVATDTSPVMVYLTRQKARAAGVSERVHPLVVSAGRVATLRAAAPFDGVYSSFGALNCEPDLPAWVDGVAQLLRPGGKLVCSVMNRWCLWEILWFTFRGQRQLARRRWTSEWCTASLTAYDGTRLTLPCRYLSAGDMKRLLSPHFTVEHVRALPVLVPPPFLDGLYRRYPRLFQFLRWWEYRLRERWPWRYLGDHVVIVARKSR